MTQIIEQEAAQEVQSIQQSESAQIIGMIGKLASDPDSDIDKMERLMAMRDKMLEKEQLAIFNTALSVMQDEIPAIAERGKGHGTIRYAKWEDVNSVIKPIMAKHGFALRFQVDTEKGVSVTATLSHKCGHEINTSMNSAADGSGSKNAIQAIGSAVSYLKRYTASALLNITSHGEDDDAYATSEADFDTSPFTDAIRAAQSMEAMNKVAADMKAQDIPSGALTMLRTAWAGRAATIQKEQKDAA